MSEAAQVSAEAQPSRGLFPRLGSVLAIAPLGVWTVWHLWENLYAWRGEAEWSARVTEVGNPVSSVLTSVVIFGPLIVHTLWGLRRLKMTKPNAMPFFGNVKYLRQRATALGVMGFLMAHVFLARIKPALHNPSGHETFEDIAAHMHHHPPTLIVYLLGVLGVAFHLANGVYTASFIHGLAASAKAMPRAQVASVLLFVALLALGWGSVAGLYEAGAQFAPPLD